jgi:Domain of unknown function (DUF4190)
MKQCPRCSQTYSDDQLNFCLNDGELLTGLVKEPPPARFADDSPPTVMMNDARVTNPTAWPQSPPSAPPAQWQAPGVPQQQQFGQFAMRPSINQTLAITSLCLGIASMTIGFCCSSGLLLSPAAMITGFIALSQIKKDPAQYGGRGLAIGGIVTGIVFISIYVLILLIYGAAILFGGLR